MKVVVGTERISFPAKKAIVEFLKNTGGHEVIEIGASSETDEVAYYDVAAETAKMLRSGGCDKAVLMCGTGAGVSIAANKFKGVFAVAVESIFAAKMASAVNNANVIAMGGWIVAPRLACEMADAFLSTPFLYGAEKNPRPRLEGREKIRNIDEANRR
jgi:ribose 5-phosphate isomerase B